MPAYKVLKTSNSEFQLTSQLNITHVSFKTSIFNSYLNVFSLFSEPDAEKLLKCLFKDLNKSNNLDSELLLL